MTKPTATTPPPADAELQAHKQIDKDAGPSWSDLDEDELRQQRERAAREAQLPAHTP